MKYKVIGFVSIFIIMILCFGANYYVLKEKPKRVDQHLTYNKKECKSDEFCTHLPIVELNYDKAPELIPYIDSKTGLRNYESIGTDGKFTLRYSDKGNYLSDKPIISNDVTARYRGNSSLDFDKHQFLLKFVDDKGIDKDVSILGMQNDNTWVLNGPFLDKTLMRNYVAYNISGKIMDSVPETRYCELFINGKYQGVYMLTESIGRTLTGITKYSERWSNGMTSYILKVDRKKDKDKGVFIDNFSKYTWKLVGSNAALIEYPSSDKLNDKLIDYIEKDFSKFEKALYSYDYKKYSEYIDTQSFVDYMIINEFFKNSDAGTHSTYLYKDVRGKIHMGPIWDFNNSANNYVQEVYSTENFMFQDKTWYDMLLKDGKFTDRVIKRYRELRKGVLSDKYIQNYIDETALYLGKSIDRNFEVWGYTFTKEPINNMLIPSDRNYTSYEEALEQYKTYLHGRGKWLDDNIDTLRQYSHFSINKIYEGK